jgi:hypothetical protein
VKRLVVAVDERQLTEFEIQLMRIVMKEDCNYSALPMG